MATKRVVIPGGSGFLGRHLTERLVARGDRVVLLTRGQAESRDNVERTSWDGRNVGPWAAALEGADALVHLSGKRVDCRPTKRNLSELISSRVEPVLGVGEAWRAASDPPPVWVQLSSLAIYGEGGEEVIEESTQPSGQGPPQMVEVCERWEAAFAHAATDVPRKVLIRAGIGIGGAGDPATERLMWLARTGLGGKVGSGKQWVSWVALDDFMAVLLRAIDSQSKTGLYHLTSPNHIRNEEMMATYRTLAGVRIGLHTPAFITRMGAWLLGSDPALAFTGRRCVPTRLLDEGYRFQTPLFADAARKAVKLPAG